MKSFNHYLTVVQESGSSIEGEWTILNHTRPIKHKGKELFNRGEIFNDFADPTVPKTATTISIGSEKLTGKTVGTKENGYANTGFEVFMHTKTGVIYYREMAKSEELLKKEVRTLEQQISTLEDVDNPPLNWTTSSVPKIIESLESLIQKLEDLEKLQGDNFDTEKLQDAEQDLKGYKELSKIMRMKNRDKLIVQKYEEYENDSERGQSVPFFIAALSLGLIKADE